MRDENADPQNNSEAQIGGSFGRADGAEQRTGEWYQFLIENSTDLLVLADAEGTILYYSPSWNPVLGYDPHELEGTDIAALLHPDDVLQARRTFEGAVEGERDVGRMTVRTRHKDGSWRLIEFVGLNRLKNPSVRGVVLNGRDVTEQVEALRALDYRFRFESLITALATGFINLPVDEIDAGIGRALEQLGRFVEVDRSYVFLFSDDGEEMSCEFEWCAEGVAPQREFLQKLRVAEQFPWFAARITSPEVVHIPRVADMPAEAAPEKAEFEREAIQSLVDVPMVHGEKILGFVGFESVTREKAFSADLINLLKLIGGLFVNAMERRRSETYLAASEVRYRSLFERAGDALMVFHGDAVVDCNSEALRLFRCTRDDMIGRSAEWFSPERQPDGRVSGSAASDLLKTANDGHEQRFEWLHRRQDDSQFYGEVTLTTVHLPEGDRVLAILRDISERRMAEQRISESEERYRTLFERSPVPNIVVARDGTIVDANNSMADSLGYTREELVGENAADFLAGPESRTLALNRTRLAFEGLSQKDMEWQVIAKDGSTRFLYEPRTTGRKYYEQGKLVGLFLELVDVTELRAAEQRERIQREQLYQSAKLVSLGTLLSGVAHEINNPNNFIRMSVDNLSGLWKDAVAILDRLYAETGAVRLVGLDYDRARGLAETMLESIREGSERIEKLVTEIKGFARKSDARGYQTVDLNEILDAALTIVRSTVNKSTSKFVSKPVPEGTQIRCDRHQIEQIIMNLVTNACQALEDRQQGITIEGRVGADGAFVELTVSDEGRGIPADVIQQVTDPFFTTRLGEGGTGLGLAVSHRIASDHGGTLEFESTEGEGTKVTLRLPIYRREPPQQREDGNE